MSFPAYAEYQNPDIEWLPKMPAHWRSASLRWLSSRYSGGTPDKNTPEYWEDGSIPWLASGEVNQALITEPSTFISEAGFANSSAKWIPEGALVMALAGQGKTKGMVAQLGIRSTCNQSMAAIVPNGEIQPRFLLWWLQSNYQNIRNMAGGDLRDGLNLDLLGDIPCPLPLPGEQAAIAAFLDRETAKIDALVEEQKRLIELLKEKRQAVISQAVTKGLDPNVPMKDSGVEWLGDVPAHWSITRLKHVSPQVTVGIVVEPSRHYAESGVPALRSLNVRQDAIVTDGVVYITASGHRLHSKSQLNAGDLVAVRSGQPGTTAVVPEELDGCNCIDLLVIRRPLAGCSEFLSRFMNSDAARIQYSHGSGGAIQQHFNVEAAGNLILAWPPMGEQREIANEVSRRVSMFDDLIEDAIIAVHLLGERRSALISAAVTGKIDVRSLAPQPEGATA